MKSFLVLSLVCFSSVLAIAEELSREEQLRVLIQETRADIADWEVSVAAAESALIAALQAENEVWERMPFSILEVYSVMAATTAAQQWLSEQRTILEYLQGLRDNYQAELDGLQTW